jgi:hypothetical protein
MKYIHHHLGLGDHMVCNGLVRKFSEKFGEITLFCKDHNYATVKDMYRDNPNIHVLSIGNHQDADSNVEKFILERGEQQNLIKVGFHDIWVNYGNFGFDIKFYLQHGLDPSIRWESFYFERNPEREKEIFNHYNVEEGKYIFIHDDERYSVLTHKINNPENFPFVRPEIGLTPSILDYALLIEKAYQVHTIESSFQLWIDCSAINKENYIHKYARPMSSPIEIITYRNVKGFIE